MATETFEQQDIQLGKGSAVWAYLGFFVLIPIIGGKNSRFAKYHANQGLALFICEIIASILTYIPVIGLVGSLLSLVCLVFAILGIVNVSKGKAAPLPLIGGLKLIKY